MSTVPQTLPNTAVHAEQEQRCFDLRLEGKSLRAIAALTGLSTSTVQRRINGAAAKYVSPKVEALRAQHDAQFDLVYEETQKIIDTTDDVDVKLKAIQTLLRIQDRQAKLHGMDAPTRVEATHTVQTQTEAELEGLFAELDRKNEQALSSLQG